MVWNGQEGPSPVSAVDRRYGIGHPVRVSRRIFGLYHNDIVMVAIVVELEITDATATTTWKRGTVAPKSKPIPIPSQTSRGSATTHKIANVKIASSTVSSTTTASTTRHHKNVVSDNDSNHLQIDPSYLQHLQTLDEIPKIVHVLFTNATALPYLIDDYSLLQYNVVGQTIRRNPGWTIRLYEHDDMLTVVQHAVDDGLLTLQEYELLERAHIVELTDVVRVILMYQVGGIYMDLDWLINVPFDDVVGQSAKLVLLSNQDHHFMQDIMISSPNNRLYLDVLKRMSWQRMHGHDGTPLPRKQGWLSREGLFSLGGPMYLRTLKETLWGSSTTTPSEPIPPIPAQRTTIQSTSMGLINADRYGHCEGATIRPFEECSIVKRTSLYRHFNITHWANDAKQRWDEIKESDY